MRKPKVKANKKTKLSPAEKLQRKIQRDHKKLIRDTFTAAGFAAVPTFRDKQFSFQGATSDLDDAFVQENIILLFEYTAGNESGTTDHLKKKKIIFDKILQNKSTFIEFLYENFPEFKMYVSTHYDIHHMRLKICYCSLARVKGETKDLVPGISYFDYNIAQYFNSVSKTVKKSARFELYDFFDLTAKDVGNGSLAPSYGTVTYEASVLPETQSHFGKDFKVVSFYMDPEALLQRAYVLRKYGWREGSRVYQRMIVQKKISEIRRYLVEQKRVFINNIIVTLPTETKLLDKKGNTLDPKVLQQTQPGTVQIPSRFNTVGIIDGQHRVFSYHEGGTNDDQIEKLRKQQNLLVTGIVFPENLSEEDRLKFEAKLFLEINSTQTGAKSELKHEINLIINPYSVESIAKRIVICLNDNHGPLRDEFERYFYDKNKIKTTSVVSFALRPLVNPMNKKSFYAIWDNPNKSAIATNSDLHVLNEYVEFCATEINKIFYAIKKNVPNEWWTTNYSEPNRMLTTVIVNGILQTLRRIVASENLYTLDEFNNKLSKISTFEFQKHKSSQYNQMGEEIFREFFNPVL